MSDWISVDERLPGDDRVLLYWQRTGHIEDGELVRLDDGRVHHILFDGETVNENPSHWMPLPEPPK